MADLTRPAEYSRGSGANRLRDQGPDTAADQASTAGAAQNRMLLLTNKPTLPARSVPRIRNV
jgi:hypothetical protein